ncbi:tRNA (adenosine(37)-N6)-threonylcarbamoyltransferase complex dimerization subunit type 1 TsaB [Thiomicrorhabdus hydrogeniphila]
MSKTIYPTVLAVETSTSACSVALIHEGKEYTQHEILPQKHAHKVLEMVEQVINASAIDANEIAVLAFGEGPGAFTGIRIASGVIQGLALGWDKPVLAVSSLQALAENYFSKNKPTDDCEWCAVMDARMKEVYILRGQYLAESKEIILETPLMISPDNIDEFLPTETTCIGFGDIEEIYPNVISKFSLWQTGLPEAISIAKIAQLNIEMAKSLEEEIPKPLYLRNHVADTIEERKIKAKLKSM